MKSLMQSMYDFDLIDSATSFIKTLNGLDKARANRTGIIKKKTFAPSGIGYGKGRCFSGDTKFVTSEGLKTMAESVGKEVIVWTGVGKGYSAGGWLPATVESFGHQKLFRLTVKRNGVLKDIYTTAEHRWIVEHDNQLKSNRDKQNIVTTEELLPGDRLWSAGSWPTQRNLSRDGIRAGFVYGDGDVDRTFNNRTGARAKLFGEKDFSLIDYFSEYPVSEPVMPKDGNVKYRRVSGLPRSYKDAPRMDESISYLYGWLAGYFAADGNVSDACTISSSSMESMNLIKDICSIVGVRYGSVSHQNRLGINGKYSDLYTISLYKNDLNEDFFIQESHKESFNALSSIPRRRAKWAVVSVEETNRFEEVFCVVQPETERFALEDDILTKNCARYWYYAFSGKHVGVDEPTYKAIRNMENGTDRHARFEKLLALTGEDVLIETEEEIWSESPPVHGFIDGQVTWNGADWIIEFKTTGQGKFKSIKASGKPPTYHVVQLMLYMYIKKYTHGMLIYEAKDSHDMFAIPVRMEGELDKYTQYLVGWLNTVYKMVNLEGKMPERCFTQKSRECGYCPFKDVCWSDDREPEIKIERLKEFKY